jgi:hypothetical protein
MNLSLEEIKVPSEESVGESVHPGSAMIDIIRSLFDYCQSRNWAGYDPYDALNSRLFKALPFLDRKLPRLFLIQGLKRSPINLRPLLLVPPTENPKALALFLSAALRLSKLGVLVEPGLPSALVNRLTDLRSKDSSHWSWGYSFPWQTRTIVVPRGNSNLVCTTFVAGALLDAFEANGDSRCLEMAKSAAEHVAKDLFWTEGEIASFSYPLPSVRVPVHNANFLAAAFLCRVARLTSDHSFYEPALCAARYSAARQNPDGSWAYGEANTQGWMDNFHTGYNLSALQAIGRDAGTAEFETRLQRGFEFYRRNFFTSDGAARYFHNRTFPVNSHSVAQSIITLLDLKHLGNDNPELAQAVFAWALKNLWDKRGFFYYQKSRMITNRISYMRWTQAWMLLAMVRLLENRSTGLTARAGNE